MKALHVITVVVSFIAGVVNIVAGVMRLNMGNVEGWWNIAVGLVFVCFVGPVFWFTLRRDYQ